jgi:hypothetical protein
LGILLLLPYVGLWGLWAIAVVQPLFDLLGRNPEFFVAHGAGPGEILIIVAALVVLLPAMLLVVVRFTGAAGMAVAVGALASAIAIQFLKQAGLQSSIVALPMAAAIGASAAVAHHRFAPVRSFVALLALAVVIVPAVFLATPSVRQFLSPERRTAGPEVRQQPGGRSPAPVLMIVIDEVPLVSLLDADEKIDPVFYPTLARLARDGIWFRNATSVSDYTGWAVPPILSGRYPAPELLPTSTHYPDSLFTLLGQTHRLVVAEVTRLCPRDLCLPLFDPLADRLAVVASDLGIVYLHLLLPDDLRSRLPPLTSGWARFASADDANGGTEGVDVDALEPGETEPAEPARRSRLQVAEGFAGWITPNDRQPSFYFLHTGLSHSPWQHLPYGQRNATRAPLPGDKGLRWIGDELGIAHYYQRHLLQLALVDRVLGRIVARLDQAGLYDDALIVITADHGASFRPNGPRRNFSEEGAAEIMRIPLIFKFPEGLPITVPVTDIDGQRVSDRNAETIDIAPTVVDALGYEMSWKADGVSLLETERGSKQIFFSSARQTRSYGREGPDAAPALRRKLGLFGGSENFYRVPRPERFGELVGRPLTELRLEEGGGRVQVRALSAFEQMVNSPDAMPFDVEGEIVEPKAGEDVQYVAVAVNGVVRAVTRTWRSVAGRWLATPPLDAWQHGANDVKIFIVEADAQGTLLRRTSQSEAPAD